MTITELIDYLEKLRARRGDMPVAVMYDEATVNLNFDVKPFAFRLEAAGDDCDDEVYEGVAIASMSAYDNLCIK